MFVGYRSDRKLDKDRSRSRSRSPERQRRSRHEDAKKSSIINKKYQYSIEEDYTDREAKRGKIKSFIIYHITSKL